MMRTSRRGAAALLAAGLLTLAVPARSTAQSDGTKVVVKDARNGKPVRGVKLAMLALGKGSGRAAVERRLRSQDAERVVFKSGRKLKPDKLGTVTLPEFTGAVLVAAKARKLWGQVVIEEPTEDAVELLLRPEVQLRVKVVDDRGKGVGGVPVQLLSSVSRGVRTLAERTTSKRGAARFRRIDPLAVGCDVALGVPLAAPVAQRVDPGKPPGKPITLVLPETGTLEVTVKNPDGSAASTGALVSLTPARIQRQRGDDVAPAVSYETPLKRGKARFRHVGTGLDLEVRVADPDGALVTSSTTVAGPRRAGQHVSTELPFGVPRPVLSGRVVDSGGDPLGAVTLTASFMRAINLDFSGPIDFSQLFGNFISAECRTATDGSFSFSLDKNPADIKTNRLRISRRIPLGKGDFGAVPVIEEVRLKLPLAGGEIPLGKLKMKRRPGIVSGLVLDLDGNAIAGAGLQLQLKQRKGWRPLSELIGSSDADGIFGIRGRSPRGKLRLVAQKEGWFLPEPVDFERGDGRCKVRLEPAASLSGSLKLPPGIAASSLDLRLEGDAARSNILGPLQKARRITVGVSGAFRVTCLRPAEGVLKLRLRGSKADLLTVEGVKLAAGENAPSKAQDIDVASRIPTTAVLVKGGDGKPFAGASVWVRNDAETPWRSFVTDSKGRATVFGQEGAFQMKIVAEGHRVFDQAAVEKETDVQLKPAKSVPFVLSLPAEVKLPEAPLFIKARLVWVDPDADEKQQRAPGPDPMQVLGGSGVFGKDRRMELSVTEPGTWQVVLSVRRGEGKNDPFWFFNEGQLPWEQENRVVMRDDEVLLSKVVKVNTAMLAAQIARFRQ